MAVYPVASGHPDFSGNYLPTIFASEMLIKFYEATVLAQIANTD
jgi:hypothetical protein